jgi:hypothetical protein
MIVTTLSGSLSPWSLLFANNLCVACLFFIFIIYILTITLDFYLELGKEVLHIWILVLVMNMMILMPQVLMVFMIVM